LTAKALQLEFLFLIPRYFVYLALLAWTAAFIGLITQTTRNLFTIPDEELLNFQPIRLCVPIQQIVSRAGVRVNYDHCGEEIINEREIIINGQPICRACASDGYYHQQEELCLPLPLQHQLV
jgi:hypothetical protein